MSMSMLAARFELLLQGFERFLGAGPNIFEQLLVQLGFELLLGFLLPGGLCLRDPGSQVFVVEGRDGLLDDLRQGVGVERGKGVNFRLLDAVAGAPSGGAQLRLLQGS